VHQFKKLLFLTDTRIPSDRASAVHVRKLLPALSEKGIGVELLSNQGNKTVWPDFNDHITHQTITLPPFKGGLFWMLWLFSKQLKKPQYDVIYSRFVLVSLIAQNKPYIIELHDDAWNKGLLFRLAFNRAKRDRNCLGFAAITQAIRVDLLKVYPDLDKQVLVIEDAASMPNSEYKATFHNRDWLSVAYVGSFHKGKGLEMVLQLAAKLPQHKFTVIGGSVDQIKPLEEKGIANLHFQGFVDHDDIWKFMQDFDVCLLPNQPDVRTGKKSNIGKYTSPLKMFEYMSYSKPIIASNLPVLKEVLDDQIAIFASPSSVEEWVHAINELLPSKKREELGQSAYLKFIENYTWEKRSERILTFINEQLEKQ
jgi:glycosyltransferase involved in cell wall biosynthesis